ncbi:MAG: phosphatidylserine decarboxylase [Bacteriovoracaceae bacterium]
MEPIRFYNRYSKQIETEQVYGGEFIQWLYGTKTGNLCSEILAKPLLSKVYGGWQDTLLSAKKIEPFIKNYKIEMDDFNYPEGKNSFASFNEFFIRSFKKGKRNFPSDAKKMGAFAEARYLGFNEVHDDSQFLVKGKMLNREKLIASDKWANTFLAGPVVIARLCPVDYHRFHFPFDGKILDSYPVHGLYHSVNPWAVQKVEGVFFNNERHVTILDNPNFGKLAYIEVGAMCVGKIVQSYSTNKANEFKNGDEKGYFLFGGSTVIIAGEKGRFKLSQDLSENSLNKLETYIHLGDEIASSN